MATRRYERISQRDYAKRLGISNTAVSKAIEAGKISKGWDKKEQKIIVQIADSEWGNVHRKLPIADILNADESEEIPEQPRKGARVTLNESTPLSEAVRLEKVAKAQLAMLELQERKGKLVDKDKVSKVLYEYGQQLRKAIERIPERTIDKVRAAADRNAALTMMDEEIHQVLQSITGVTENALENKQ